MILPNKEPSYPHYFHALSPTEISSVKVTGDVEIGYIGFGSKGLHSHVMPNALQGHVSIIAKRFDPTQQSNFSSFRFAARSSSWVQLDLCLPGGRGENHSFVICRQLIFNSIQVFNHDWFATPFVLTTCQPNGVFDPPDWDIFDCVLRE